MQQERLAQHITHMMFPSLSVVRFGDGILWFSRPSRRSFLGVGGCICIVSKWSQGREERHLHSHLCLWGRVFEVVMRSGSRQRRERTRPPWQPYWAKMGLGAAALEVRCQWSRLVSPLGQYAHHRNVAMCCTCFPQVRVLLIVL